MRRWALIAGLRVASLVRSILMRILPLRVRAVKAMVRLEDEKVLLVRHSYGSGAWMLPGGQAHRGEAYIDAAGREISEELGLELPDEGWRLVGEFSHRFGMTRQRIGLCTAVASDPTIVPNHEIAEAGFVDPGDPPEATSGATLRRLDEWVSGTLRDGPW